ncbi:MAG: SpoIIIAC/SpoIIIAD family protein [Bacillota bacterium]|nr:SpoIIIAC/SpoIIIAD family protein [Bacillota bacterium]
MDSLIKLIPFSVVVALITLTVKKDNPQIALLISVSAVLVLLLALLQQMQTVSGFLEEIYRYSELSEDTFSPLLKIVGVSVVTGISSQLCRDANENALAYAAELLGVIAAVIIAIPLFTRVLSIIISLANI